MAAIAAPHVMWPERCNAKRKLNCDRPALMPRPAKHKFIIIIIVARSKRLVARSAEFSLTFCRDGTISFSARCRCIHTDRVSTSRLHPTPRPAPIPASALASPAIADAHQGRIQGVAPSGTCRPEPRRHVLKRTIRSRRSTKESAFALNTAHDVDLLVRRHPAALGSPGARMYLQGGCFSTCCTKRGALRPMRSHRSQPTMQGALINRATSLNASWMPGQHSARYAAHVLERDA